MLIANKVKNLSRVSISIVKTASAFSSSYAATVFANLMIGLVLVQLPHLCSYPLLCARPHGRFRQSQASVRQITGGAW